jgi:putative Holliday junction resolvase
VDKKIYSSGKVAGIDYGTVRIGIAVSDPDRIIASPYENYTRKNQKSDDAYFCRLVNEERIVQFVVGLPLHISGDLSPKAEEVLEFGHYLQKLTGVKVDYFDERFTSVEAERILMQAGLTDKKRKQRRDMLAAQILLSGYLESGCQGIKKYQGLDD